MSGVIKVVRRSEKDIIYQRYIHVVTLTFPSIVYYINTDMTKEEEVSYDLGRLLLTSERCWYPDGLVCAWIKDHSVELWQIPHLRTLRVAKDYLQGVADLDITPEEAFAKIPTAYVDLEITYV